MEPAEVGVARATLEQMLADGVTELAGGGPIVRDQARRAGWTGPLRGPLRYTGAPGPVETVAAVGALVPLLRVTEKPTSARFVDRMLRRAVTGVEHIAEIVVADRSGLDPFRVSYPDRDDLLVEELARVIDVAAAMRGRFGDALAHVRLVAIDLGQQGFASSHVAGTASPILGNVHLNASFFLPDGLVTLAAAREARDPREQRPAPARPMLAGTSTIDGTMAHELWHQVELAFTSRRYRDSIAFRQAVGAYFGVETLEHAVTRPGPAHDRLVHEVSEYGATKAIEATAEMAKLWWYGVDTPVVRHFASVVDDFFPPHPEGISGAGGI